MKKKHGFTQLNRLLRYTLLSYRITYGLSQEEVAFRMRMTPRACCALENGEYGFSAFSMTALLSLLPLEERLRLLNQLCALMEDWRQEAAW